MKRLLHEIKLFNNHHKYIGAFKFQTSADASVAKRWAIIMAIKRYKSTATNTIQKC